MRELIKDINPRQIGFIILDHNWKISYIQDEISSMLGRPLRELRGRNVWVEYPGLENSEFSRACHSVMESKGSRAFQAEIVPLKAWVEVLVSWHPGGIAIHIRDITEQMKARNALEQNKGHLALAQEISETGSWEWCIPSGIITWSEGMCRIFGHSPKNNEVNYRESLDQIHPDDKDRVVCAIKNALEGRGILDLEHRIILPDTSLRHLHLRGVGQWDEHGAPCRMTGIVKDVSAQKRLETELRDHAARLEQSNQELELFASIASHDLQEPLRKISAFGERLATTCGASLDDRGNEYLNRILSSIGRMRNLIDDLLSFSRITSRARPFERVDLGEVARNAWQELEIRVDEIGAHMDLGSLPHVLADPGQMHQLFVNLMSNALKYHRTDVIPTLKIYSCSPEQGNSGQMDCFDRSQGICVEDNGIGFEDKYADRIFAIFHRLHGRGQYEGTGIGLAVCSKIIERHGGNIEAHGEPDKGSVFTIRLPDNQYMREIPINEIHNNFIGRRRSG